MRRGAQPGGAHTPKDWTIIITTLVQVVTAIATIFALVYSVRSFQQTTSLQAGTAAAQVLQSHYEYVADEGVIAGVVLPEMQTSKTSESQREDDRALKSAIHGVITANIIYDLTEETGERPQGEETARELLDQYQVYVERADLRCGEFDDEFQVFAEEVLGANWCRHLSKR